jgi:hypothetical protein
VDIPFYTSDKNIFFISPLTNTGGSMGTNQSRRKFIKAGLALSAAGIVSSTGIKPTFGQEEPKVVYRTLGKTGLKVSGVGMA